MAFTHLHHVGFMLEDFEPFRTMLRDVFGFPQLAGEPVEGNLVESDNVQIVNVPVDDTLLEINYPRDDVSGSARWMKKKGPGIHHICFYTDDIDKDTQYCVDKGLQLVEGPSGSPDQKGGARASFFHPRSTAGILVELWQNMPD